MIRKKLLGLSLSVCVGIAALGCKDQAGMTVKADEKPSQGVAKSTETGTLSKPADSAKPEQPLAGGAHTVDASKPTDAVKPADVAKPAEVTKPGVNPTAETPTKPPTDVPAKPDAGVDPIKPPAVTAPGPAADPAIAKANDPVPIAPVAPATPPATEPGVNPLFTLPPSKGPAPHKFQQVSLLRTSANGDLNLEMQLTGDGIYRIRDHGHGKSYAGNGVLDEKEIAEWAAELKDWDSLKESYLPTPAPKDVETVEIIYGGKKVVALTSDKELPKTFADAYKRLLALNERGRKEAAATEEPKTTTPTPEPKPEGDAVKPATPKPAPAAAPAPAPAQEEKKDGK